MIPKIVDVSLCLDHYLNNSDMALLGGNVDWSPALLFMGGDKWYVVGVELRNLSKPLNYPP